MFDNNDNDHATDEGHSDYGKPMCQDAKQQGSDGQISTPRVTHVTIGGAINWSC